MEARDFLPNGNPLEKLMEWLEDAKALSLREPNALLLSTVDSEGAPSARVVLYKELRPEGLIFYTNYDSAKGRQLEREPRAAITFYWDALQRQVRMTGSVTPLSAEESDRYWNSRPRASQISQWTSRQSEPIRDRATLEAAYRSAEERFTGKPVPRPGHWGGYLFTADRIEFWIGHPHRLHDRFLFTRSAGGWSGLRLSP